MSQVQRSGASVFCDIISIINSGKSYLVVTVDTIKQVKDRSRTQFLMMC